MRNRLPTIAAVGVLALLTVACVSFMTRAEQAEMSGFLVLDRFVALEHAQGPALEAVAPGAHALAEEVRRRAPEILRAYDDALALYRSTPTLANEQAVTAWMGKLMDLVSRAEAIINAWHAHEKGGVR